MTLQRSYLLKGRAISSQKSMTCLFSFLICLNFYIIVLLLPRSSSCKPLLSISDQIFFFLSHLFLSFIALVTWVVGFFFLLCFLHIPNTSFKFFQLAVSLATDHRESNLQSENVLNLYIFLRNSWCHLLVQLQKCSCNSTAKSAVEIRLLVTQIHRCIRAYV